MLSRTRIKTLSILLVLGFILLAGGCHQPKENPQGKGQALVTNYGSVRVGVVEEVASLDPIFVQSYAEMQVARALYEGLFTLEQDTGRLIPLLVEAWELSPDEKTYTFRLRKGVKFHSTRELTAEDVKFSWQRALLYSTSEDLVNTLGLIEGARDYKAGRTIEVGGILVADPYTLQVTLERPYRQFLLALTHPAAAIVDKQVLQLVGEQYGEPGTHQSPLVVLVGTGAFSIVEWIGGHQITLQLFEQYHGEIPDIKRLEFIQYPDLEALYTDFQAEYLELVFAPKLPSWVEVEENQITSLPGTEFYYLGFNTLIKPFNNLEIRQAISSSLDRVALAENFHGIALECLLPRHLLQERPPRSRYWLAPQQVRETLSDEAMEPFQEQSLVLAFSEGEEWNLIANQIQKQLESVGFSVRLQSLPMTEFRRAMNKGEISFFLDRWQSPLPSPQFFFESRFASWGLANRGNFSDQTVDERLAFIQNGADSDRERLESLLEIEQRVQNDALLLSLWQTDRYICFKQDVERLPLLPNGLVAWEKCFY